MAAVVNRHGDHYSVHRLVLPDGSEFKFAEQNKDAAQELHRGVLAAESLADATSAASNVSVAEKTGTVKRDYSLRGAREHEQSAAEAQKQGKRLEERAAFQRANVKNAAKPGAGELDRIARGLLKDFSSQYDRAELTAQLERLYDRLAKGSLSGKALATEAEQVARRVLTEVSVMGEEGAELRRELRQTKIHVPRELWADFEDVQKAKEIFAENPNIFLTFSQKQVKKSCILQGRVVDYQGIPHGSGFFVMCFPKEGWRKR